MKILVVNKYLMPKGGAETYAFDVGEGLQNAGHEVEYFGMDNPDRTVGNKIDEYVNYIDFHSSSLKKLIYPFKIIYSFEAARKIKRVLYAFNPDIVHINNFNYQLTPSIIYAVRSYVKKSGRTVKTVYTAHDPQLVCPNHMLNNPNTHEICEKCTDGSCISCVRGKCVHGSFLRSVLGAFECWLYRRLKTYRLLDMIICPSRFMSDILATDPLLADKCSVLPNFSKQTDMPDAQKGNYALYFGRYSYEKGIETLLNACVGLSDVNFKFAGAGPLNDMVSSVKNVENVGFKSGDELTALIAEARFSIVPSECYENCPFSLIESISCHTPVIGAKIGGIPELIREGETGLLFESKNTDDLMKKIRYLWDNPDINGEMTANCGADAFLTREEYCRKLVEKYEELLGTSAGEAAKEGVA